MSEANTSVTDDQREQMVPTLLESILYLGSAGVTSVNGKTGVVILMASDVGALPSSTVIPSVYDGVFTVKVNGTTVGVFSANSSQNRSIDISVPTQVSELTNDANYIKQSAVDSSIDVHNQSNVAHAYIRGLIDAISVLVPTQATTSNQLADKAFVNSSVQTASANFRGSWANWAAVPTDASLYPADYSGSTTPTTNDYTVIQDASDFPVGTGETALTGTWRFKYTGDWATVGRNGWQKEYQVNEEPLTAAQIAALNSGITAALTAQITTNANNITNKVDTSKIKTAQSTTAGDIYDVTYVNSMIGNIETLLAAI